MGLSTLSTTHLTTNWSEPKLSSRAPSLPSILLHSDSGMNLTTPLLWAVRRTPNLQKRKTKLSTAKKSASVAKKYDERKKSAEVASSLVEQFQQGRLIARISARPGQSGRADGYILEGKELDFYVRKLKAKKTK